MIAGVTIEIRLEAAAAGGEARASGIRAWQGRKP
jgi:hypothetical protein